MNDAFSRNFLSIDVHILEIAGDSFHRKSPSMQIQSRNVVYEKKIRVKLLATLHAHILYISIGIYYLQNTVKNSDKNNPMGLVERWWPVKC